MKLLTDCLYRYSSKSHANIVTGDFNCPGINWFTLHSQNDGVHNVFLDYVIIAGLSQCVDFSTRGRNTLDLVGYLLTMTSWSTVLWLTMCLVIAITILSSLLLY